MSSERHGLGIFGGTFDPPHIGHLAAAVEVRSALRLERVELMVANQPWQKAGERQLSSAFDRLALTEAAVRGIEGLAASDLEIQRGGPTYTFDTLCELRGSDPACQLFLIVGADAARGLPTWHRYEELGELATLVIVDREGDAHVEPPAGWAALHVAMPRLDVSSSDLRHRAQIGLPLAPYVPAEVVAGARARGLYGLRKS
ncbi:MAG: nicotinate-nucleotide adenylyltransferase [Acidimicrobiales bacterium]